jgi:hypothetical protein
LKHRRGRLKHSSSAQGLMKFQSKSGIGRWAEFSSFKINKPSLETIFPKLNQRKGLFKMSLELENFSMFSLLDGNEVPHGIWK